MSPVRLDLKLGKSLRERANTREYSHPRVDSTFLTRGLLFSPSVVRVFRLGNLCVTLYFSLLVCISFHSCIFSISRSEVQELMLSEYGEKLRFHP